jgi:hypothetical protein
MSSSYEFYSAVTTEPCAECGAADDNRLGFCFDCARSGEEKAAKRSVLKHLWTGFVGLLRPRRWYRVRYDFSWAWQRLARTGDYAKGGTFDREGYNWR